MNQQERVVRAIDAETGSKLSQSYLSQIESGARPHLTNTTRQLLAGFFKVHPGYLVDDPEGYSPELQSELRNVEDKLDLWLVDGAERFRRDPELKQALLAVARHENSRECLLLLESILETPELLPRLMEVLRPKREAATQSNEGAQTSNAETDTETWGATMNWESFYLICFLIGLGLERRLSPRRHGPLRRPRACAAHRARRSSAPRRDAHIRRAEQRNRSRKRALVERVLVDDFSLLVWRGRLSADALWQLCCRCRSCAGRVCAAWRAARLSFCSSQRCCCLMSASSRQTRPTLWAQWAMFLRPFAQEAQGEIMYEQLGARRSAPARSETGETFDKQDEVYVIAWEKGIAYVRRWMKPWATANRKGCPAGRRTGVPK